MSMKYGAGAFHAHTDNSVKDGLQTVKEYVARVKELGGTAASLTDHGVLTGVPSFIQECRKQGINPVVGEEAYVMEDGASARLHLVLIAKDNEGYRAISALSTESFTRTDKVGKLLFPCMNRAMLEKHIGPGAPGHGHVAGTSACIGGVLAGLAIESGKASAERSKLLKAVSASEQASAAIAAKQKELDRLGGEKQRMDALVKKTYAQRRKLALKLEGQEKEEALAQISLEEEESAAAKEELPAIRDSIARIKKAMTALRKDVLPDGILKKKKDAAEAAGSRILEGDRLREAFRREAAEYGRIFGQGNFYVEIQSHGIPAEDRIMPVLAGIAGELGLPLIAANDAHMAARGDLEARKYLTAMRFPDFKWEGPQPGEGEMYVKTDEEMEEALLKVLTPEQAGEAMANAGRLMASCHVEPAKEDHYPRYSQEMDREQAGEELERLCRAGSGRYAEWTGELEARLQKELGTIRSMGYADYFLIVQEYLEAGRLAGHMTDSALEELRAALPGMDAEGMLEFMRSRQEAPGYSVGPGRGSGAGSLVCYLTGITDIDPIRHGLIFERFLNPARVSMPDIDSDFSNAARDLAIEYCRKKYGQDSVCGIMTRGTFGAKAAIENAGKVHGSRVCGDPKKFAGFIKKANSLIPDAPGTALAPFREAILEKAGEDREDAEKILDIAERLEGRCLQTGRTASGYIIADGGVKEHAPLMYDPEGKIWNVQMDKDEAEACAGLLKFDFLGLMNLDIITDCLRMVDRNMPGELERLGSISELPSHADPEVIREVFAKGETDFVFQFESQGMKAMLRGFGPEDFDDLVLLVAAYRPGPMEFLKEIVGRRQKGLPPKYAIPQLEPILRDTYGAMIYQEQIMQICMSLAGYSMGQADVMRRIMGKKKTGEVEAQRWPFIHGDLVNGIAGCEARGISAEAANILFSQMAKFAQYAFNKSHAAAYASVAYITAHLKYHYPAEYMAAVMARAPFDKMGSVAACCRRAGIPLLPPDINRSGALPSAEGGKVLLGIRNIKGVESSAKGIIEGRARGPYLGIMDFVERLEPKKNVLSKLILGGAFSSMGNRIGNGGDGEPAKSRRSAERGCASEQMSLLAALRNRKDALSKLRRLTEVRALMESGDTARATELNGGKKPSIKNLDTRIRTAGADADEAAAAIAVLRGAQGPGSPADDLEAEAECLGAYISGHPLDAYEGPAAEAPLTEDRKGAQVLGIPVPKSMKSGISKKGNFYAFFQLDTRAGQIGCSCFDKEAAEAVSRGGALLLRGDIRPDREDPEKKDFLVRSARPALRKAGRMLLHVSSAAGWALEAYPLLMAEGEPEGEAYRVAWHDLSEGYIRDTCLKAGPGFIKRHGARFGIELGA